MANTDIDESMLDDQNRDVVYERDVEKVIEDQDASETLDENERPGLLSGEPFIPPVSMMGPNVGGPNVGMAGTGAGFMPGIPPAVVPVVDESGDHIDTGVLVNPFTPADPDNERPFEADMPSPVDLAARVEAELAADGRFPATGISVVNDEGVIRLEGSVPSDEVAADVAAMVARIPGVRGVENLLRAEPPL